MTVVTLFLSRTQNTVMMSLFPGLPYCWMGCHQSPEMDFQRGVVPLLSCETKNGIYCSNLLRRAGWVPGKFTSMCLLGLPALLLSGGKRTARGIQSKSTTLTLLRTPGLQPGLSRVE